MPADISNDGPGAIESSRGTHFDGPPLCGQRRVRPLREGRRLTVYKGKLPHEETSAIQDRPKDVLGIAGRHPNPMPPATVTRSNLFYGK